MTDLEATLAAVLAEPDDDIVRLAYADTLEGTDTPSNVARAAFIRVQIELANYAGPCAGCGSMSAAYGGNKIGSEVSIARIEVPRYDSSMTPEKRGILIVFEGIDGAGKTTQVELLKEFIDLIGEPVIRSKEPTDGPWGQKIRASASNGRMPLDEELNAFIEDRKEHVRKLIDPALAAGTSVILDRYFYSTIAYQGTHGADVSEVTKTMLELFPIPDVVYLIDVPAEIGILRVEEGRGETPNAFEQVEGLRRARQAFLTLANRHKNICKIDGVSGVPTVRYRILRHLLDGVLKSRFCAKSYGCDDPLMCGPRMNNECCWVQLCRIASQFYPANELATQS